VVINSLASQQLSLRKGVSVRVIPNVMDFDHPPEPPERTTAEVRALLGFAEDAEEHLVLQPTRVVQRKGIEHAIELVKRMGLKARLVVSHDQIDEGHGYVRRIVEYADLLGVKLEFLADKVRQRGNGGVVSLGDLYRAADLVTYPSTIEGFGNALVEAIYYRRPVVVNRYSIYSLDIAPKGFRMIEFDDYITDDVVAEARKVVETPALAEEMTEHNYQLGRRYYSYRMLEAQLQALVRDCLGEGPA
jgi:glycosyltransferase involved in cell wall biosynthesis